MKKITERPLIRSLKRNIVGIDFTSNDYLGLARSIDLHQEIARRYEALSPSRNGSTGSRLLSGNSALIETAEHELAKLFDREATLIFDSGYMANLAVLSTLPQRGDTIILDDRAHASLKDGAKLSNANKWNFRHNDVDDLEKKLKSATGDRWVVIESIYSMDGDTAPLETILEVTERHGAHLILDEAHSTGTYGTNGAGWSHALGLHQRIPVTVFTFGKAMGVHGAAVACTQHIANLLINFARPFIYTTAPSNHMVTSILTAFSFLKHNPASKEQLRKNIECFKRAATSVAGWVPTDTQIQIVVVPGQDRARAAAEKIQLAGFDVRAILAPTVAEGSERLRISLHAFNTTEEIEGLVKHL